MKKSFIVKSMSAIALAVLLLFQLCACFESKNFEPGRLIIVLTPEESAKMLTYTPDDFANVGCIEIRELTSHGNAQKPNFKRMFVLYIEDNSAIGVGHAAEILKGREGIESATVDSIVSID